MAWLRAAGRLIIRARAAVLPGQSVIFALQGELGAGKTQFSKGIARALGVTEAVTSPTFIIERDYILPTGHLFHIDTWRLFDKQELLDLGFMKKIEEGNVFAIEWADRFSELIDQVANDAVIIWVGLQYGSNETERIIKVSDYTV